MTRMLVHDDYCEGSHFQRGKWAALEGIQTHNVVGLQTDQLIFRPPTPKQRLWRSNISLTTCTHVDATDESLLEEGGSEEGDDGGNGFSEQDLTDLEDEASKCSPVDDSSTLEMPFETGKNKHFSTILKYELTLNTLCSLHLCNRDGSHHIHTAGEGQSAAQAALIKLWIWHRGKWSRWWRQEKCFHRAWFEDFQTKTYQTWPN